MQFGKLLLLGAALAAFVPVATADILLTGEIDTSGTATIKATVIVFANTLQTKTDIHYLQSPGAVTAASGSLSEFSAGTLWYVPDATSLTMSSTGRYLGRDIANLVYSTATVATPVLLYQVFEGADTLDFYVTDVTSDEVGTNHAPGTLSADGYVTLNGGDMTNGNFTLTDVNDYGGKSPFTSRFVIPVPVTTVASSVPEPGSLALLGTGMIGIAGFAFRKRNKIKD
jgi:hypothetical protein